MTKLFADAGGQPRRTLTIDAGLGTWQFGRTALTYDHEPTSPAYAGCFPKLPRRCHAFTKQCLDAHAG